MFCWKCGAENDNSATYCVKCGQQMKPDATQAHRIEDDPGMRLLLPVGRTGLSIAAGYAGLFAVTLVLAPFALFLGILALRDLKARPEKLGKGRAVFGVVMGLLGTIGLLAMLLNMGFVRSIFQ